MSAVETSSSGLTKKQKKAQAFRDRKRPGGKPPKPTPDDLPEMDVLEDAEEGEEDKVEVKQVKNGKATEAKIKEKGKGKGKEKQADAVADEDKEETEEKEKKKSKKEVNQRFILFVGRIPFKTTSEQIAAHFEEGTGTRPKVRLLTSKPTPATAFHPATPSKSRGIAFLEFPDSRSLQLGLRLHHTELDGKVINVELTAGGGGGGETRKRKLQERNERVGGQREKRKAAEDGGEEGGDVAEGGEEPASAAGTTEEGSGDKKKRVRMRKSQVAAKFGAKEDNDSTSLQPGWAARKEGKFATAAPSRGGPSGRGRGGGRGGRGDARGGRGGGGRGGFGGRAAWQPTGSNAMIVG